MNIYKILLPGIFALLAQPAASKNQSAGFKPKDGMSMLEHLTNIKHPLDWYLKTYPQFTFKSQAQIKNPPSHLNLFKATTQIQFSGPGNMSISRQPFPPIDPVELIIRNGLIYIRPGLDKTFYQIKNNLELEHLKMTILKEILQPFANPRLKKTTPTQQNGRICHASSGQSICFDPETKLPIQGKFEGHEIFESLSFVFEIQNVNIKIQTPKDIHRLRKHGQL